MKMKYLLCLLLVSLESKGAHWALDADAASLKIHGTIKSASGALDQCLVLDGGSVIELKDSASLNAGPNGFTFSVWFNPYATEDGQQVIAGKNRYSLGERQWTLTVEPDGRLKLHVQQAGWMTIASKEPLKAGHWYFATLTLDSGKASLFLNGQQVGQARLRKPMPITQAPITLGGINDNSRRTQMFTGAVDEARFEPRALSAEEITANYQPVTVTHKNSQTDLRGDVALG